MSDDKSGIKIREVFEVKKFNGDDQTQPPVEVITIVYENGIEVSREIIRG